MQVCGNGNFATEFVLNNVTGMLECPATTQCQTYQSAYGNSKTMCDTIFGATFKTSTNEDTCINLWPTATTGASEQGRGLPEAIAITALLAFARKALAAH